MNRCATVPTVLKSNTCAVPLGSQQVDDMQVKYQLCGLFTLDFLMAVIDVVYGASGANHDERELHSARQLATVDGLIWG